MDYYLNIPNKVDRILGTLRRAGFKAYVVGGCVRDILLGGNPEDWDITTSATPGEVKEIFSPGTKIVETGLRHGTVTLVISGENFEVTTFRSDGTYSDGRHPDSVSFTRDVRDDLSRRDFTMNALCYSPDEGIIDEFGGISDLREKRIKTVGDPEKRFGEDYLRVMRAIRFTGTLGFMMDGATEAAVKKYAGSLSEVSSERINTEFTKLISGAYAAYAVKRFRHELDTVLAKFGLRISDRKSVKSLEHAPASLPLRLALVLDITDPGRSGEDAFADALKGFRYDGKTIKEAAAIKELSLRKIYPEKAVLRLEMRKLAENFDDPDVPDILMDGISVRSLKSILPDRTTEKAFGVVSGILENGECYSRSGLKVTGTDLTDAGMEPGPKVGRVLDALLDEVIAGETENEKNALMTRGKKIYDIL